MNLSYKKPAGGGISGHNKTFSVNKEAITGIYPAYTIDYSKVQLIKGALMNAGGPTAASTAAGKLVFTWTDNSDGENELISDMSFVSAYNPDARRWVQKQKIATRNAGTRRLDVAAYSGKTMQTYIGFASADNKKISDSLYIGVVNI
jgi:hypothetical protein